MARFRFLALAVLSSVASPAFAQSSPSIDWPTYGFNRMRWSNNPSETAISAATVGGLIQIWAFNAAAFDHTRNPILARRASTLAGQPIVAANVQTADGPKDLVLDGDGNGFFFALDANSSDPNGSVVWSDDLGRKAVGGFTHTFGVRSTAVLDRSDPGAVYVASNVQVFGLDLASGAILPNWPVSMEDADNDDTDGHIHGGLNLAGGYLYAGVGAVGGDLPPFFGRVVRIPTASPAAYTAWYPLSGTNVQPTISGGGVWGWGGVAIDDSTPDNDVYAATGNAIGTPQQAVYAENIVHLTNDIGTVLGAATPIFRNVGNLDYGTTPIVVTPDGCSTKLVLARNKNGKMVVDTVQADGSLALAQQVWVSGKGGAESLGTAAYDPVNKLLLVSVSLHGPAPYGSGLAALNVNCASPWLTPAWQATQMPDGTPIMPDGNHISSPIVANGLAFFGVETESGSSKMVAVLTQPDGPQPAGTVVWASPLVPGTFNSSVPTVVNGMLYFAPTQSQGASPTLYAFGLPPAMGARWRLLHAPERILPRAGLKAFHPAISARPPGLASTTPE